MAAAGEWRFPTAAVEWVLKIPVDGVGAVRVVRGAEGRRVVELHVGQHCSEGQGESEESGFHVCK